MAVQVGQISPADLEKKTRILSLLESRRKTYGSVALRIVLVKDRGEWKSSCAIFEALYKDDQPAEDETHPYPNFTLARRSISLDQFASLIEDLVTKGSVKIDDLPEFAPRGNFSQLGYYERVSSNDEIFKLDWPADSFTFDPKSKGSLPAEPFVSLTSPLYPGAWEVVRLWTGVDVSRHNTFLGSLVFLLPNFSAKIQELRLASGVLTITVNPREIAASNIVGKVYCEKLGGQTLQRDIGFEGNSATVPLGFTPDWWQVYIVSKTDGAALDYRKVHASSSALPIGVVVELGQADIEEILRRGENDQVEFKLDISKKPDEFLETVIAFANTLGGTVFVGVDDNGKAVGTIEQKLEERIQDMVRSKCEPHPEVNVEKRDFQGGLIYLVQVAAGTERPYNLRDRGFFVRAGSTDRLATRIEMDKFYADRLSPLASRRLY